MLGILVLRLNCGHDERGDSPREGQMTCRYETLRAWYDRAGGLELGDSGLPAIASACYTVGGEGPECLARHQCERFRDSMHLKNQRVRSSGRCRFCRQPSKDEVWEKTRNLTRASVTETLNRDPNVWHANSVRGFSDSMHRKYRRVRSFGRCTFWRQPSKDEVRFEKKGYTRKSPGAAGTCLASLEDMLSTIFVSLQKTDYKT